MLHTKDEDCTIDPKTDCCLECGVDHSGECPICGGHGFHKAGCSAMDKTTFTLTLNGEFLGIDFESKDAAEKFAEETAERLFKQLKESKKFPWGFAFKITEN